MKESRAMHRLVVQFVNAQGDLVQHEIQAMVEQGRSVQAAAADALGIGLGSIVRLAAYNQDDQGQEIRVV